jgi:hypothetical protein
LFALMRIEGRAKSRASDATPAILPTLNLTNPAQGASSGFPLEFTPRKAAAGMSGVRLRRCPA